MTQSPAAITRPRLPLAVVGARILVLTQLVIGVVIALMLGFIGILGIAWTTDDDHTVSPLAALFVVGGVALVVLLSGATAMVFQSDPRSWRNLVGMESVLSGAMLVLAATSRASGVDAFLTAPLVIAAFGVAIVVLALRSNTRAWSSSRR